MSAVREAAARTLAAGSARVFQWRRIEGSPSRVTQIAEVNSEGVADFGSRRTEMRVTSAPGLDRLWRWMSERAPGLPERSPDDEHEAFTVYAGGARFFVCGDAVRREADGPVDGPRSHEDPTWVLDALAGVRDERHEGSSVEVRGESCEWWRTVADLRAAGASLDLPPHGSVARPTLQADVWVGRDGLVRRVTWLQTPWGRPRFHKRNPPRMVTTLELWDFGLPVAIEVPRVTG